MTGDPGEFEDLGSIGDLPVADPRRRALDDHPGARARLLAYRDFMAAPAAPAAERLAEAEARLSAVLAREIGITEDAVNAPPDSGARVPEPSAGPAGGATAAMPGPRLVKLSSVGSRRPWFGVRVARPAFAMAAVLVVAAGVAWFTARRDAREGSVLRGTWAPMTDRFWNPRPGFRVTPNAGVVLRWNPHPRASRYVVVFLGGDLAEADRIDGITSTELVLTRDALPTRLVAGSKVLWRVVAFDGADEIGRSSPAPLTLP